MYFVLTVVQWLVFVIAVDRFFFFFFFQAEDGIRDLIVTGVQTCALPILRSFSISSSGRPKLSPMASEKRATRSEWPRVYGSLPSMAAASALTVPMKRDRKSVV